MELLRSCKEAGLNVACVLPPGSDAPNDIPSAFAPLAIPHDVAAAAASFGAPIQDLVIAPYGDPLNGRWSDEAFADVSTQLKAILG